MTTKIEWCDLTWNPVRGCLNNCPYCYARDMNQRFWFEVLLNENYYFQKIDQSKCVYCKSKYGYHELLDNLRTFKPTWLEHQFQKKLPNKPKRIFIGSMSDIFYWKPEWMERVLNKIKEYPQHTFMFLTKNPDVYEDYIFPSNCWLGWTMTKYDPEQWHWSMGVFKRKVNKTFISIEPIQNEIILPNDTYSKKIDWAIIGAETGNRKKRVIPKKEWLNYLVNSFHVYRVPIFLKNNLKPIWGEDLIQEIPK